MIDIMLKDVELKKKRKKGLLSVLDEPMNRLI
jgi:hypothetical protein